MGAQALLFFCLARFSAQSYALSRLALNVALRPETERKASATLAFTLKRDKAYAFLNVGFDYLASRNCTRCKDSKKDYSTAILQRKKSPNHLVADEATSGGPAPRYHVEAPSIVLSCSRPMVVGPPRPMVTRAALAFFLYFVCFVSGWSDVPLHDAVRRPSMLP